MVKQLLTSSPSRPATPWPSPHCSGQPASLTLPPPSATAAAAAVAVTAAASNNSCVAATLGSTAPASAPPSPPASPPPPGSPVLSMAVIEAVAAELLSLGYMVQVRAVLIQALPQSNFCFCLTDLWMGCQAPRRVAFRRAKQWHSPASTSTACRAWCCWTGELCLCRGLCDNATTQ